MYIWLQAMNTQQTIIKGIRELLYLHQYVVLPGFGGFVLRNLPARYNATATALSPPSKLLGFNSRLKQSDGTLELWLQQQSHLDGQNAAVQIRDFAEYCSSVLEARRRLSLGEIGFFYLDFENNICFEPGQGLNFAADSFGLSEVVATPLAAPAAEKKDITLTEDRKLSGTITIKAPEHKKRRRVPALSLFLGGLLLITLGYIVLMENPTGGTWRASIFGTHESPAYKPIEYGALNLGTFSSAADAVKEPAPASEIAVEKTPAPDEAKPSSALANGQNYKIVLGCFSVHENAVRLVDRLSAKGLQVAISGKNSRGMYVVSHGAYSSKQDAKSHLEEMQVIAPGAWIK
jgi:hypothetical protein